ncbi:DUF3192 domain-containing protein [Shewanella gaetbuli]
MQSKATYIIGAVFISYLCFVIVVMFTYEPSPEERAWEDRQAYNQQKISEIAFGQTIEDIQKIFGRADFVEAKTAEDGQYQLLYYRTHHIKSDGITTRDECTPLLFKNNELIAWGTETYQQYVDAKILTTSDITAESI